MPGDPVRVFLLWFTRGLFSTLLKNRLFGYNVSASPWPAPQTIIIKHRIDSHDPDANTFRMIFRVRSSIKEIFLQWHQDFFLGSKSRVLVQYEVGSYHVSALRLPLRVTEVLDD